MGLFGDLSKISAKSAITTSTTKSRLGNGRKKQPTLLQLAEEKFGTDRKLMMWIGGFLEQKREVHLLPTRLAWAQQLSYLEEWPESEREEQVRRSIACGYRSLAYKYTGKKVAPQPKSNYQAEEEILYDRGF